MGAIAKHVQTPICDEETHSSYPFGQMQTHPEDIRRLSGGRLDLLPHRRFGLSERQLAIPNGAPFQSAGIRGRPNPLSPMQWADRPGSRGQSGSGQGTTQEQNFKQGRIR